MAIRAPDGANNWQEKMYRKYPKGKKKFRTSKVIYTEHSMVVKADMGILILNTNGTDTFSNYGINITLVCMKSPTCN